MRGSAVHEDQAAPVRISSDGLSPAATAALACSDAGEPRTRNENQTHTGRSGHAPPTVAYLRVARLEGGGRLARVSVSLSKAAATALGLRAGEGGARGFAGRAREGSLGSEPSERVFLFSAAESDATADRATVVVR